MERRALIAGNWKMNLDREGATRLVRAIQSETRGMEGPEVLVAPPFPYLSLVRDLIGPAPILLGAQNMHPEAQGAFTGEVSGPMLRDVGCTHVILGHSERRTLFGETDTGVSGKLRAALLLGLHPIVCIGETLAQREAGETFSVLEGQLRGSLACLLQDQGVPFSLTLAYEPVWAIGTGRNATPAQAQEVHAHVRGWIAGAFGKERADGLRILYGGSVNPGNIRDLMAEPDIDGALVGGASLKAETFIPLFRYR